MRDYVIAATTEKMGLPYEGTTSQQVVWNKPLWMGVGAENFSQKDTIRRPSDA
jgi:hypothetical protein